MKVTIGVSKRHVHLTEETYKLLFGNTNIEVRNKLNQPGQFASTSTVDLIVKDKIIEHVRVVGPFRKYNQIELDNDDCTLLNINPPRRQSGDLEGSKPITVQGPVARIYLEKGTIKAERHLHLDSKTAMLNCFEDKEIVEVYKDGKYIFDTKVKITNEAYPEIHIDLCEEKEFNIHTNEEVEIRKCGK